MPNTLAYVVLFCWPVAAMILFRVMPPLRAMIWTILGGYLFLPSRVGIDPPLLPTLDKRLIPVLAAGALIMWAVSKERRRAAVLARRGGPDAAVVPSAPAPSGRLRQLFGGMIVLLLLVPVAIYLGNREPLVYGPRVLPAMRPYDIFSMALAWAMALLPFLLGRRYLATAEAHREILMALVWGGLIYSLLMAVEIRLSPQLNRWLYDFFPHSFGQHMRGGSFRPIVFLEHGLLVAIFAAMACLAAVGLARRRHPVWWAAAGWIAVILMLSSNLGALFILVVIGSIAAFAGRRMQILAIACVAGLTLFYPMLRGAGLVPTGPVLSLATAINPQRAQSLDFRFHNEDMLLEKANRKPIFGWGSWGRSRVFDEDGRDISVTDGVWVIEMGTSGWAGYLLTFGLLTLPLLLPAFGIGRPPDPVTVALGVVLSANLVDMLPNASLTPLTWMIAGALAGRLQRSAAAEPAAEPDPAARPPRERRPPARSRPDTAAAAGRGAPVYSRFEGPASRSPRS